VALGAHVTDHGSINKIFILGAVGPVEDDALHEQVFISGVYSLLTDRMSRVLLPVMACPAEFYDRRLVEQETVV